MFKATNPYSKRIFLPHLIERLLDGFDRKAKRERPEDPRGADKAVFVFVTITDWRWATCDNNIQFDLAKAKQKVRNALGGTNFACKFEAALYVNVQHTHQGVQGKLVLFHCHALVWASSLSKLKRMRDSVRHRFVAPPGTKTSMKMQRVPRDDVAKVVGYIAKLPVLGYRAVRTEERNTQVRARLRPSSHYRFFNAMTDFSMFDFWLAGGEGKVALRAARNDAHREAASGPRVLAFKNRRPMISAIRTVPQSRNRPRALGVTGGKRAST